jgi:hypothetical protein
MSTVTMIPAELLYELQDRLARAASGVLDPEEMRKACEHMDRAREELQRRIGTVEVAVELIRDARNR